MLGEFLLLDRLANEAAARGDHDEDDRLHLVACDHLERCAQAVPRDVAELVRSCRVAGWLVSHGDLDEALSAHVRLALCHVVKAARCGSPNLPDLLTFLNRLPVERDGWVRMALSSIARASLSAVEA